MSCSVATAACACIATSAWSTWPVACSRRSSDRLRFGSRWYRVASASSLSSADWIAASYADGDPMRFARRRSRSGRRIGRRLPQAAVREHREPVRQAMAYERLTHLPAIVATGDRMTMGAAIEARLPFTDPALLEFAGLARTRRPIQRTARQAAAARGDGRQAAAEVLIRREAGLDLALFDLPARAARAARLACRRSPSTRAVAASSPRPRWSADGRRRVPGGRQPPLARRVDARPHRAVAPGVRRTRTRARSAKSG